VWTITSSAGVRKRGKSSQEDKVTRNVEEDEEGIASTGDLRRGLIGTKVSN